MCGCGGKDNNPTPPGPVDTPHAQVRNRTSSDLPRQVYINQQHGSAPPPPPPPLPPPLLPPQVRKPATNRARPEASQSRAKSTSPPPPKANPSAQELTDAVLEANGAIARCLEERTDVHWALVGGACLLALGSRRATTDVDIVVSPPNLLGEARSALSTDRRFHTDPRTRHTTYLASNSVAIEVEFLSYPGTFRSPFDTQTPTLTTPRGVSCLNLAGLLESKCATMPGRSSSSKRETDGRDILFILGEVARSGQTLDRAQVPSANTDFQDWFENIFEGSRAEFQRVGL
jgi:hypothetical protein